MLPASDLDEIIGRFEGRKGITIPLLQEVQKREGFLSRESMRYIAQNTQLKLADLYGVATFYAMFRLRPQGKNVVRVCLGTACHVSGAQGVLGAMRNELGLDDGEDTTADGQFTLLEVACLGCCSLAPVIMVNDTTHGQIDPNHLGQILAKYRG
jgi:NADH:ubiquinone oxidoreductase subunit E